MIIPDAVRKSVAFILADAGGGQKPVGTCFFVLRRTERAGRTAVYVVTAKHVIDGIRRTTVDQTAHLRLNKADHGTATLRVPVGEWHHDPDPEDPVTDVAIARIDWQIGEYDHVAIRKQDFADPRQFEGLDIGVGRDLFLTGLFVNHYGASRNIPIVRTGSIAALPEEPVKTKAGFMRAYLVECRSVGGLSGSPVFVHLGPLTGSSGHLRQVSDEFYCLGVMHGHWHADVLADAQPKEDSLGKELVNMGIGIVLPAAQVLSCIRYLETLDHS